MTLHIPPNQQPRPIHGEKLEGPRRAVAWAFVVVGIWYLAWRATTLNPDAPWFSALVWGAEIFGFATALLHLFMCWRLSVREAPLPRAGLTVDVFVPSYNESVDLVRKTLIAAREMRYPHRTWLLDDGRREEMRQLAAELGVNYLTRADNVHAKAGNLNHALARTDGEFVAIFDADHAPARDFLVRTLGYFEDEAVAFVQTPQDFYNLDSYQHRRDRGGQGRIWTEQSLFFRVIQRGKDMWNSAFFCGSCAVVRRSSLDAIGGFATGTVTEDLHTSIRLHAKGFRSVYHAEPLAFGLAPESLEPFLSQRIRWGQGAMHVWRMEGLLTHRGLSLAQRLNYFASVLTYFDGWQKGIFYFAPVIVLLTGTMPLIVDTPSFLLHFVPYYLLTFWVFEEVARGYGRTLFIEQYNMARFAAFAWSTLAWVLPRRWLKFKVTAKGMLADGQTRHLLPQGAVVALNLLAIPFGVLFYLLWHELPLHGLVANIAWAAANAAMAVAVLLFTRRTGRFTRGGYRFPVPLPARLAVGDAPPVAGTVDDISDRGLRFYGALPRGVAVDLPVRGRVLLPDGPLAFTGSVRSLTGAEAADGAPSAVGCTLELAPAERQRLEAFLYGSDLQWTLNGLSDRVHTPLSRWFPRWVQGPRPDPFAGLKWNGATLRDDRARSRLVLAGTPTGVSPAGGPAHAGVARPLLVAFEPLATGTTMLLEVDRRRGGGAVAVRLEACPDLRLDGGLQAYALAPASVKSLPMPRPVAPSSPTRGETHDDFVETAT